MQKSKPKVTETLIKLPWGNIAGKIWSGNHGPKFLCIHGLFSNAGCFDNLIPVLMDRIGGTWLCLDLPGCGKSDSYPPGVMTHVLQYVLDIYKVVLSIGWSSCHVVAHSAGNIFGLYLTSYFPNVVESYVSIDMVMLNILFENSFVSERMQVLIEKTLSIAEPKVYSKEGAIDKLQSSRITKLSEKSVEILFKRSAIEMPGGFILNNDPRFYQMIAYPTVTMNIHEAMLRDINCPLLLILLSDLVFIHQVPPNKFTFDVLKSHLGSKLRIVNIEGSHDMFMEDPKQIATEIERHLTQFTSKL